MTPVKESTVTACLILYLFLSLKDVIRHVLQIPGRATLRVRNVTYLVILFQVSGFWLKQLLIGTSLFCFEATIYVMCAIYLLCSGRQTHISYVLRGGSLYNVVASLEPSYAIEALYLLKVLIPCPLLGSSYLMAFFLTFPY